LSPVTDIASNLAAVRSRIAAAAARVGRRPDDVTLVAVSKTFGADHVKAAHAAGQRDFGENKVQEGLQKQGETADIPLRWHLIGHVQSNKAKKAASGFASIQSVDSLDLLRRLDEAAAARTTTAGPLEVLVQVDFAGEATKFGASADDAAALVEHAQTTRALALKGLMLLPPWSEDPERTRPWFARLRAFRDRLVQNGAPAASLSQLSMGMSHDYEVAIEEGATIVRVGTAIFGKRPRPLEP
jgi:PLP dependent protein